MSDAPVDYKKLAQQEKARKLATHLMAGKTPISSEDANLITREQWNELGLRLGLKTPPSVETIALTIQEMREREAAALAVDGAQ